MIYIYVCKSFPTMHDKGLKVNIKKSWRNQKA